MDNLLFNKLIEVLSIQTNSDNEKLMVLYLDKELKKLKVNYHIDAPGNILVTKGKSNMYPCVTSHMDTVHDFVPNFKVYTDIDDDNTLFALSNKRRVGIGGDDKCGIFACLYLLKVIPQIKVVFFSKEEKGCQGSTNIDKNFFNDCRYLIELDRRGNKDFIQTYWGDKTISHEFSSEIGLIKKKYKYKNATGTVTDVMKLWYNKVGISCINLSCGYYQPHTNFEHISISDLWNSIKFTEEIICSMKARKYVSYPPVASTIKATRYNNSENKREQCPDCKKWTSFLYLVDKRLPNGTVLRNIKVCWQCRKTIYDRFKTETNTKISETETNKSNDNNRVLFACHECGIKTNEMPNSSSLKLIGGLLYCSDCAALFKIPDKKQDPKICYMCEKEIPKNKIPIVDEAMSNATSSRWVYLCEDCDKKLGKGENKDKCEEN